MPARQLMRMASLVLVFVVIEPELYDRFDIDKTYAIFFKKVLHRHRKAGSIDLQISV